ncbi:MAG: ankyrin repeat domain-containing protein [Verrucomicrobiota bacterium]|jgi:hypothetical protein|nr:ankyrin repeat domain-containing protein [Verrucomicrobiota bacterium]MDP7049634.1 ankyrin repeat domain-containing protein [Verrucomicrobiota bacterium]
MSGYPCRLILCLPLWWIVSAHAAPELPIWAAASWRNDIATVRAHIAAGTNIDTLDDWTGKTALHYAAEYGHLEIAGLLLANGADANRRDDDQATPLYFAAVGGFVDVARLLLVYGADINARDKARETPMDGAVFFGHMNVANVFREHLRITRYNYDTRFHLEASALTAGMYGFLNKKKRIESRLFQLQASSDLVHWRLMKLFDTSRPPFTYSESRLTQFSRRFFRLRPFTMPLNPPVNRIYPDYESYKAGPIDGTLDGVASEWIPANFVVNPGFEVVEEGQRGEGTFIIGDITYAQFAEVGNGKWDGEKDHFSSIAVGWNNDGIQITIVVDDDLHHHTKGDADEGDAVRLLFTDGDRNEIIGEYMFALVEPYLGDRFLYNRDTMANTVKGSMVGHAKQLSGMGGFDAVIRRTQKTLASDGLGHPNTGTTVYELWFSPGAIGAEALKQNFVFGLGIAVIDSDPDAPGKQGWSGWGPDSVVFEKNTGEVALITLVGDPEENAGDRGE